jgi:hypothetical protein
MRCKYSKCIIENMQCEISIADRIQAAVNLRKLYGHSLMQDREICALVRSLDRRIAATQSAMEESGIVNECADCAVNEQGTCCGVRTGHKCDILTLLINLLLGIDIPLVPADTRHCHFLTQRGCALRARHVICINFVCQRLRDTIPHKSLCGVQEIAGREIDVLFFLEESIKKKIGLSSLLKNRRTNGI